MQNDKKLSQEQIDQLLKMVGKKLGSQPSKLKSQLENGSIENIIKGLNPDQAGKLQDVLANPILTQKLLNSKQAQNIINSLSKEK